MSATSPPARHAVFDHESEGGRPRRRRPAPDWGGDDLFDHVPRRRFVRTDEPGARRPGADAPARRRGAEAGPVTAPRPAAVERPAPVLELIEARRAEYTPEPPTAQRRTVTITGRPGPAFAPRVSGGGRPRAPRTVEERIVARPDLLAGWAVALAILLILLALFS